LLAIVMMLRCTLYDAFLYKKIMEIVSDIGNIQAMNTMYLKPGNNISPLIHYVIQPRII
jgi:hypothetical protein